MYFLIFGKLFFKTSKNLVASAFFFFDETDTKKHRYALIKAMTFASY